MKILIFFTSGTCLKKVKVMLSKALADRFHFWSVWHVNIKVGWVRSFTAAIWVITSGSVEVFLRFFLRRFFFWREGEDLREDSPGLIAFSVFGWFASEKLKIFLKILQSFRNLRIVKKWDNFFKDKNWQKLIKIEKSGSLKNLKKIIFLLTLLCILLS